MYCEECGAQLWRAGEVAPSGRYVRVDDPFARVITLDQPGPLPGAFNGHRTLYHQAGSCCTCLPSTRHEERVAPSADHK